MSGNNENSPYAIEVAERQAKALALRKRGLSFEAIAAELDFASRSGAYEAVKAGLDKTLREPAEELRQLELARLDVMLEGIYKNVAYGNRDAISTALRISERRSRLLGLDRRGTPLSVELPKLEKAADALPVTAALLEKTAAGELLPGDAAKLAGLVSYFAKMAGTAALEDRIGKLEETHARRGAETNGERHEPSGT